MPPLFCDHHHHTTGFLMENELRNCTKIPCEGRVKCVLVGDGAVGKTSLVVSYTTNGYPTEYVPTAFDNYNVVVTVDDHPVRLQLCDTAGQDDFDTLRPLCYPSTDVFLLCFSVVSPTSFYNVSDKWIPEIRHHNPQTPILLVGTQCDLRSDVKVLIDLANYREQPVSETEARQLAQRLGVSAYIECSALTQKNLKEVFDTAILLVVQRNECLQKTISNGKAKNGKKVKRTTDDGGSGRGNSGLDDLVLCSDKWLQEQQNGNGHIGFKKKKGWKKFLCFTS